MLKKILILIFGAFILFSCGEEDRVDGLVDYTGTGFTVGIPEKWELLKDETNILPKPSSGKLELATTSKVKIDDFYNSFVILSEDLEENITSKEYSSLNNLAQKENYYSYDEVGSEDLVCGDEENLDISTVYISDVEYSSDLKKVRFLQTGIVCGQKGYILTLSVPTNMDDILKYKYILSTFKCK